MNAQSIWAGNDYAFIPERGRSERFSLKAHRVRVRRILRETRPGNSKASTFVEVNFVDRDTGEFIEYPSWFGIVEKLPEGTFKVRAYDFVEHWDNVADHYRVLVKRQEQEKSEREERERERRERMEREAAERQAKLDSVKNYLLQKGVQPEWIESIAHDGYSSYGGGIRLSFRRVETSMLEERERGSRSLYDVAKGSEQSRD